MSKIEFIERIMQLRDHSDLHKMYVEFEESKLLHKYSPILLYLLLHPRNKRYSGTLTWALLETDPSQYFPVFIHIIRTGNYETSLWIYQYLIERIPNWSLENKQMICLMAEDSNQMKIAKYKKAMLSEIVIIASE